MTTTKEYNVCPKKKMLKANKEDEKNCSEYNNIVNGFVGVMKNIVVHNGR